MVSDGEDPGPKRMSRYLWMAYHAVQNRKRRNVRFGNVGNNNGGVPSAWQSNEILFGIACNLSELSSAGDLQRCDAVVV